MRKLLLASAIALLPVASWAGPVSVIQLSQTSNSNTVVGANNALLTGATGATTITISNQVANVSQLLDNSPFNGVDVNLTATSTDNATTVAGGILQHFAGNFCISTGPNCTGTDLLSGNFTDAAFGVNGGSQLSVNIANPPDTLNMSSALIPSSQLAAPSSLTFGFTSLNPTPPGLQIGANSSINPFTASFTMNASASPLATPEPASLGLLGLGVLGLGLVARRRGGAS